ncbi:MAG: ABC-F family ATP-binding cassette domain-containing protein [Euryarchaeota archaeon]|nr:ABC-F family ATP-binding cassette domain-containing protein [Euryarchaeota archaeon]
MLIRAEGISKSFGPKDVLKNVSFHVEDNDRIGLVGPNGSGKTTLLKIIMGEVRQDSGNINVRTNNIVHLSQFPSFDDDNTINEVLHEEPKSEEQKRIDELDAIMVSGILPPGMDWNDISLEYAMLQESLVSVNKSGAERALDHLKTFGIDDRANGVVSELSGGEKAKVHLSKILAQAERADLLILDEPTNHLDIDAVEWLEDYLLDFKGSVIIVSHDRYFLDRTVTQIFDLDGSKLHRYGGNYSQFVDKKSMELERQRKEFERNTRERDRHARIAKEQHQALWFSSTHKTRLKMLERMEVVQAPNEEKELNIEITTAQKSGRNMVIAENFKVLRAGRPIFEDIDLEINNGDKLGIFGPNGSGKTTLVKALIGEIPSRGELWMAPGARIGYFAQGHDDLIPELSAFEQIDKILVGNARARARSYLYRFYITREDAERPISTLSGGERARVMLSILLSSELNFLILDEPTNHLDVMAKHAVEVALANYDGTFLIVTHDRYLLDSACSKVAELKDGTLKLYNGSYSQFKGVRSGREMVEEAEIYRVVSNFTEWTTRKKYSSGERILIAPSEKANYQWAIDTGKLRRIPGKDRKLVRKSIPEVSEVDS